MAKKPQDFMEMIQESYSNYIVADSHNDKVVALTTGSISLDFSTGVGGIPKGKFTEIFGPEAGGKTTLCLNTIKYVLRNGKKACYVDIEHGLNYDYIRAVIGNENLSNLVLIQPKTAEEAFKICESAIDSGEFEFIGLDSVGALSPADEREKEFDAATVGIVSKYLAKFCRRNVESIKASNTAFVFVNQIRDKIGAYVATVEPPGGHALKHFCSLRIMITPALGKDDRIMEGDKEVGIMAKFTIKKNKLAKPFKSFFFPIIWGEGIDSYRDLVEFATTLGVIERAGSYYRLDGENIGQGQAKVIEFLKNDKLALDKIEKMVYNIMDNERTKANEQKLEHT